MWVDRSPRVPIIMRLILESLFSAAATIVALFIGGRQAAEVVPPDPESPLSYATRTRGNPALHSNTMEGS
ncbi:uncharacterized protein METZ01_LOCUS396370 [marine metagenome]|uniref:Uncharacterized protein n=1 Tax=marine metagenome TaxID=408172 RepID=A0A382VAE9_9ZZZZ